jgi:hypothetical protein
MLGEAHSYVADFPSLPADVRAGLGSGTYHLGASRQVQGNLRPVVVDEHGVRVKDVTLRKACGGPGAWGALAGVALQIQVRQLSEKLDEIQTWQKYQVACDRNRALYDPFRTARESIYQAQLCGDEGERREHLLYAEKELGRALSSACSDIETTSLSLAAATERSFFLRKRRIGDFMGILSEDLRFASQITGLRLLTLDYLGKTSDAGLALNTYQMSLKRLSAGATSSTPRGTAPGLPRPARSSSRRPRGAAGTPMWRAPGSRSPAAMPPSPARATTP